MSILPGYWMINYVFDRGSNEGTMLLEVLHSEPIGGQELLDIIRSEIGDPDAQIVIRNMVRIGS